MHWVPPHTRALNVSDRSTYPAAMPTSVVTLQLLALTSAERGGGVGAVLGGIVVLLLVAALLALVVWSLVWAYRDAEDRGKSGCLVVLLVLLISWPVGLLAWYVFRPEKREGAEGRLGG